MQLASSYRFSELNDQPLLVLIFTSRLMLVVVFETVVDATHLSLKLILMHLLLEHQQVLQSAFFLVKACQDPFKTSTGAGDLWYLCMCAGTWHQRGNVVQTFNKCTDTVVQNDRASMVKKTRGEEIVTGITSPTLTGHWPKHMSCLIEMESPAPCSLQKPRKNG